MNNRQVMEMDAKYVGRTFARFPLAVARGEGARLWDADGRAYLDFFSGLAVNSLGHCHPAVLEAMRAQAGRFAHCSNLYHCEAQAKLARLLCQESFAEKVYFANTGAEATELCLKIARKHGAARGRFEVVAMENSFHGRTYGALSATGQPKYHKGFEPMLPGIRHVPFNDLEAVEAAVGPKTAAVLVEPIQGEGGVRVADDAYLRGLRRLCDRRQILLIFDEIQTGLGRTGRLFYYQHLGKDCLPDLMPLAKSLGGGLPLSAVLARGRAARVLGLGDHGTTMGGNPVACAAGLASLETLLLHDLPHKALLWGEVLQQGLLRIKKRAGLIREVRGRGYMVGAELAGPALPVAQEALRLGLMVNATAGNVLRLLPPLIAQGPEIEEALKILDAVFKNPKIQGQLKKKK